MEQKITCHARSTIFVQVVILGVGHIVSRDHSEQVANSLGRHDYVGQVAFDVTI